MSPPGATSAEPLAYLNGQLVSQAQACLPFHDAGFIFGAAATDLCRTIGHRLYRWPDHLARFRQSCRYACIPQTVADDELSALAEHLVKHNAALLPPDRDLVLVLFATPGPIGYYAGQEGGPGDGPPTLAMHTFPLPLARYRRLFEQGAHLVVPATHHVPAQCVDPRAKQRSRLHWWLAEQEAHRIEPGAMALLLDEEGWITETAGANFLFVQDDYVLSPPRRSILGGISLLTVEELCPELGLRFEERPLRVEDCLAGGEALLTSTPYCVAGVRRINGAPLSWPGPVWHDLLNAWSRLVGVNLRAQFEHAGSGS